VAIWRDDVANIEVNAGTRDDAVAQRKKPAKDLLVNEKNYDIKNEKNEKHEETKGQGAHAKLHIRML